MDATTNIAAKVEGSRVAAMGLDARDRAHFLDAYGDDKALCGTVVGATWYRMNEWVRVPGGSTPCTRCLKAERKVVEAQAHMARIAEEDRQRKAATEVPGCTVIVSATGDRCGDLAVDVREGIFGGTIAECDFHHTATHAPTAIDAPVEIHWHTWAKQGLVVAESDKELKVQFVPRAGAEAIVRSFPRDAVRFL